MIDKSKPINKILYNGEELPISGGGEVDDKDIVFYIRVPNFPAREVYYKGEQITNTARSAYGETWAANNDMGMRGVACVSPDLAIMQFNEGLVDAIGLCNLFCVRYTPFIIPEFDINMVHTLVMQLALNGVSISENASMAELKQACEELGWLATEEDWLAELEYWKNYQFEEK